MINFLQYIGDLVSIQDGLGEGGAWHCSFWPILCSTLWRTQAVFLLTVQGIIPKM